MLTETCKKLTPLTLSLVLLAGCAGKAKIDNENTGTSNVTPSVPEYSGPFQKKLSNELANINEEKCPRDLKTTRKECSALTTYSLDFFNIKQKIKELNK